MGGYTPELNPGERDLVLIDGQAELAVIEAVIIDGSIAKASLVEHFRKLLGYGDCPLYFHLTYAWHPEIARLIETLEDIAREEAPDGHVLEGIEQAARTANEPKGFVARYRRGDEIIRVVFRVLDLGQRRSRDAAAASALPPNKPSRRSPKKKA